MEFHGLYEQIILTSNKEYLRVLHHMIDNSQGMPLGQYMLLTKGPSGQLITISATFNFREISRCLHQLKEIMTDPRFDCWAFDAGYEERFRAFTQPVASFEQVQFPIVRRTLATLLGGDMVKPLQFT